MSTNGHDVFLSYSLNQRVVADRVRDAFSQAGLKVFDAIAHLLHGSPIASAIQNAIAGSDAVVMILPAEGGLTAGVGIELGAAMGWNKPIYVLYPDAGRPQLSRLVLGVGVRVYPLSRLDDVVGEIKRRQKPIPARDRDLLLATFNEMDVSLDRLIDDPFLLDELARRYRERTKSSAEPERLLHELLRMRKQGSLPRRPRTRASRL